MLFYLEWLAVLLGIINVGLLVRRSIWNYPFGIVMVTLYFVIFVDARLYADAGLQVFFVLTQIYGWISWRRVQENAGEIVVQWSSPVLILGTAALTGFAAISFGLVLGNYTDAAAPLPDATIAVMSIAAQILMVLRRIESWVYWIAVDLLAIWLFWTRDLNPTAGLYAVFLVLASMGLWQWLKALRAQADSKGDPGLGVVA